MCVLREDSQLVDGDEYLRLVPLHRPIQMYFGIVGEVVLTDECKPCFERLFGGAHKRGRFFEWPGAEAIYVCPGTGAVVEPTPSQNIRGAPVHLLVAQQIKGAIPAGDGVPSEAVGQHTTRMIPRILTVEGYERLMGGGAKDAEHRCIQSQRHTGSGRPAVMLRPMYPNLVRMMNCALHRRHLSEEEIVADPGDVPPASMAWEDFEQHGGNTAFQAYLNDRMARHLGMRVN